MNAYYEIFLQNGETFVIYFKFVMYELICCKLTPFSVIILSKDSSNIILIIFEESFLQILLEFRYFRMGLEFF